VARAPESTRRVPSPEYLLLDYVRRLEEHKEGRQAVQIHLSNLRPFNRREHHVRVAADNFESLIESLQGQLFTLKNADLCFIYKAEAHTAVENAVQRIRFLFSDDPLLSEVETETRRFCTWFDVDSEFDVLLKFAQGLVNAEESQDADSGTRLDTRTALRANQGKGEPLTPLILSRMEAALTRTDLSNLVRRQFICSLGPKMAPDPQFSELFISIMDLRDTILPGVDLSSSPWLFQHLTQTLDTRMLSMLSKTDHITISGDISFNLNVATMLSPQFLGFDENVPASRRGHLIIEMQVVDLFADLGAYMFARGFAQERGYRICIDGLTYQTMSMIDRERLGADMVKLYWHPQLIDGGNDMVGRIRAMINRSGDQRVILCRCDNREAIDFGRSVGITLFQGRHVENLIAEENRRRELRRLKVRVQRNN
jgi:hypothetical protein